MSDGRQLEAIVAHLEEALKPEGFTIEKNDKVFDDDGHQIAEFDIIVRGSFGSTSMNWLIECRDRPSQGAAPNSWIEQLVGRKSRFGFNKVTAVSTTGFAPGVNDFASAEGIELREVAATDPACFSNWITGATFPCVERRTELKSARLVVSELEPKEALNALHELLAKIDSNQKLLRAAQSLQVHSLGDVFHSVVTQEELFDSMQPDVGQRTINIHAKFANLDDRFSVETEHGVIPIESIYFTGSLVVTETQKSVAFAGQYRSFDSESVFSEVVSFEPLEFDGKKFALEMHNIGETGETQVMLRRVKGETGSR